MIKIQSHRNTFLNFRAGELSRKVQPLREQSTNTRATYIFVFHSVGDQIRENMWNLHAVNGNTGPWNAFLDLVKEEIARATNV